MLQKQVEIDRKLFFYYDENEKFETGDFDLSDKPPSEWRDLMQDEV